MSDVTDITLADVKRLTLGPGDALLITLPAHFDADEINYTLRGVQELLPDIKVLVVTEGIDVSVITDETAPASVPSLWPGAHGGTATPLPKGQAR